MVPIYLPAHAYEAPVEVGLSLGHLRLPLHVLIEEMLVYEVSNILGAYPGLVGDLSGTDPSVAWDSIEDPPDQRLRPPARAT